MCSVVVTAAAAELVAAASELCRCDIPRAALSSSVSVRSTASFSPSFTIVVIIIMLPLLLLLLLLLLAVIGVVVAPAAVKFRPPRLPEGIVDGSTLPPPPPLE